LAHAGNYQAARVALVSTQRLLQRGMAGGAQRDYIKCVACRAMLLRVDG
jgi:hypothetical protein